MRVELLGTGAAWPIPRLGCDCAQCTSDDPRDRRLRSSIMVEGRVLVDAGPDCYHQLRRAGDLPEAVVITHAHHDHVLGVHDLAKLGRIPMHIAKPAERELRKLFPRIDQRIMHMTPGVPIDLGGGLECRPFDVQHGSTPTLGLRFTQGPASLVYIPDTGAPPDSRLARDADLLILDGSRKTNTFSGHLSMEDAIPIVRRLRAKRTLFTHIGHRAGTHAELEAWLPDGFGVAHDTQIVEVA
jgi:phosphoribosyl 1,2-cyclic phosphate phosphodiesterase